MVVLPEALGSGEYVPPYVVVNGLEREPVAWFGVEDGQGHLAQMVQDLRIQGGVFADAELTQALSAEALRGMIEAQAEGDEKHGGPAATVFVRASDQHSGEAASRELDEFRTHYDDCHDSTSTSHFWEIMALLVAIFFIIIIGYAYMYKGSGKSVSGNNEMSSKEMEVDAPSERAIRLTIDNEQDLQTEYIQQHMAMPRSQSQEEDVYQQLLRSIGSETALMAQEDQVDVVEFYSGDDSAGEY